jgi:hypothetical protein
MADIRYLERAMNVGVPAAAGQRRIWQVAPIFWCNAVRRVTFT